MTKPRIVITLGDPAGIGPEIVFKALSSLAVRRACRPIVVGDKRLVPFYHARGTGGDLTDLPFEGFRSLKAGSPTAATGAASARWIERAVGMIGEGAADALVTAPISKEAIHAAGVPYPGHTELLASLTGTKNYGMLMAAGSLRAIMVTRHLPLRDAGKHLTQKNVRDTARLAESFLRKRWKIRKPRVGVCALNPHAGEAGLLGGEEKAVIAPAVRALARGGMRATGPLPADAAWKSMVAGDLDLLVAMYHDQVMIPLKVLSPEKIVNITVGLPFVRTSPGHGTAFDIAGKNRADPRPMIEAILAAARLSSN